MKKIISVKKIIPKLPDVKKLAIKLSETTLDTTTKANVFFSGVGDFFMFLWLTTKATFSRGFEFQEFLRQCYQIGNKTLPLISVTGLVIGLVLTIRTGNFCHCYILYREAAEPV